RSRHLRDEAPERALRRLRARRRGARASPARDEGSYFLAERTSLSSLTAARHIGPPEASYSACTCFLNSGIIVSCLSGGTVSSVRERMPTALAVAAWARSIHRPTSFQSLSKKTTTGMDW